MSGVHRAGQRAFEAALDSLRRVRSAFASLFEVRIGEDIGRLPERLNGVLPVAHPDSPTLVRERPERHVAWQTVEAMAEALMYLIGRPYFTDALRLAAARLRASDVRLDELDEEDVAEACGVTVIDVRMTVRRVEVAIAVAQPALSRCCAQGGADTPASRLAVLDTAAAEGVKLSEAGASEIR